jgi:HD-GYP domain-containing protein (c-di-GMP phosphodiesterase class II)
MVGDFLFVNDARLRLELSQYAAFSHVTGLLHRHGIGSVELLSELRAADFAPFLSLLIREADGDDAFERFHESLSATGVRSIVVDLEQEGRPHGSGDEESRDVAKRTYFQSVHVAREVLTDARLGRAVNVRRVKRAVQSIVDQVLSDEDSMLGMTALRDYDEYTFTHSVNVCILSVIIGQKLGLSKLQLYELGLGALFHDIGKQRIDAQIVNKSGSLTDEEWREMQRHPTDGLLALFSMRGLSDVPYRTMLMAYEHHMKIDLTGYPLSSRSRQLTLFSRIVAAADGFDAATSRRSYQAQPWPPDEVLREMRDNPRRGFDPLLVKALINVTGVFPVGTLAILDTFELAVVVARNPDAAAIHQPIVKIVADGYGSMLAQPLDADLAEIDPATGKPRRSVVKTTSPEKHGIRISDYFV